jgi:hypothetical protein
VYCKVFEDNSGALELARLPWLRPRTKHINVCYHHLQEHARKGLIKIFPLDTKDQIADTLTKALAQKDFVRHCKLMCGQWTYMPHTRIIGRACLNICILYVLYVRTYPLYTNDPYLGTYWVFPEDSPLFPGHHPKTSIWPYKTKIEAPRHSKKSMTYNFGVSNLIFIFILLTLFKLTISLLLQYYNNCN